MVCGKGPRTYMPSPGVPCSQHLPKVTNPEGLSIPYSLIKALSHIHDQLLSQFPEPFPFLEGGDEAECSKLLIKCWIFLVIISHLQVITEPTKSHLIRAKDASVTLITQEILRVSRSSVPGIGYKDQIFNLLYYRRVYLHFSDKETEAKRNMSCVILLARGIWLWLDLSVCKAHF